MGLPFREFSWYLKWEPAARFIDATLPGMATEEAARWAEPELSRLSGEWLLEDVTPLGNGACSYCCSARMRDGTQVILKLPANPEVGRREALALSRWGGVDTPKLYRSDEATGASLMQFVDNAEHLSLARAEDAMFHIPRKLVRLGQQAEDIELPAASDLEGFAWRLHGAAVRFVYERMEREAKLLNSLLPQLDNFLEDESVIVHGDASNRNILRQVQPERFWVIDPMPFRGHPLLDLAWWIVSQDDNAPAIDDLATVAAASVGADIDDLLQLCTLLSAVEIAPPGTPWHERRRLQLERYTEYSRL